MRRAAVQNAAAAAIAASAASAAAPASAPRAAEPELEAKRKKAERRSGRQGQGRAGQASRRASADNCSRARAQLPTLQSGNRIAQTNAKTGEREFLDDKQRADETRRTQDVIADRLQVGRGSARAAARRFLARRRRASLGSIVSGR